MTLELLLIHMLEVGLLGYIAGVITVQVLK